MSHAEPLGSREQQAFAAMVTEMPSELRNVARVEQLRRSAAMLPPRSPCLNREQAIAVLEALIAALLECRRLRG